MIPIDLVARVTERQMDMEVDQQETEARNAQELRRSSILRNPVSQDVTNSEAQEEPEEKLNPTRSEIRVDTGEVRPATSE
jgi:hypothetical protein